MTEDPKADVQTALSGRFIFEQQLGEGGFGTVYRARDTLRDATVAVKVLNRVDPSSLFNFKTEFRALTSLVHPNLVQLHELLARGSEWLLSMELIEGGDFLRFVRPLITSQRSEASGPSGQDSSPGSTSSITPSVGSPRSTPGVVSLLPAYQPSENDPARGAKRRKRRRTGALDEGRLRSALRQLCDGLGALHRANRLHRDLKPANVLVRAEDGRVAICDFGLVAEVGGVPRVARELDASGASSSTGSRSSQGREKVVGTVAYMSPEQAMGERLTGASDWYAVGVMLYQALTDEMPFSPGLTFRAAVAAKQQGSFLHPCMLVENVPGDLADLAVALLAAEPSARPGYAEVVAILERRVRHASDGPKAAEQLIGRHEQLAQLHAAFARARSGSATVAMVAGRSGMGKSALVRRFLDEVAQREAAVVLAGRCYEREELPYKAFDPLLDALSTHLMQLDQGALAELLPERIHELANLFPVLRRVPAIESTFRASEVNDPLEQKHRAFRAFREICRRLAQQRPLVFYIDDLQWGDLDSGQIFVELLHLPQPPAALLVCAFRSEDEEQSPLLQALRDTHLPEAGITPFDVRVGALGESESRELAASLLEGCQDAAAAVQFVAAEAAGRPFFVRELALYVRAHGALAQGLTLESLIETRFSALPAESRCLLSIIAVAGRPERRAVVERAAKLGEKTMSALHALEAQNFVHSSGSRADDRVEAYHDRIRETVYKLLDEAERAHLHRELALSLEQSQEVDSEALLEHWRGAGERKQAGTYALQAAHKADAALAFERAARLYREALSLLALSGEQARELEERLGHALARCGRGIEAADAFFRALPGAPAAMAMQLRSVATSQLLRAGQVARALHELAHARDLIGMAVPTTNLVTIIMLLWRRARIRLKRMTFRPRARPAALQALLRADMLWEVGSGLSCMDLLRGSVYQAEYLLLALKLGDPLRLARALSIEAIMCATANKNPARTQLFIDRGYETAGISGDPGAISIAKGTAGVCRMLEGRFREAVDLTGWARESIRDRSYHTRAWEQVTMAFFELQSTACLGNVGEIIERVPELLRDAEARGDLYAAVSYRTWRCSWAWLGLDQPDEARRHVQLAEGQWTQAGYHLQHWYTSQALAEIELYCGSVEASQARLEAEWKRMFFLQQIQHTRIEMWYLRARVQIALARHAFKPELLRSARADANRLLKERTLWSGALGRLLLACVASFEAPDEALAILRELEGQFDVIDMRLHVEVTRYRRGELMRNEEGAQLMREATEQIRRLGVTRPEAFVQMLAPGFPPAGRGRSQDLQ